MKLAEMPVTSAQNFEPVTHQYQLGDRRVLQNILQNFLYKNPLRVVIQEYASNGRDAHRAKGNANRPIEIKLPGKLDPSLVIRDFGHGIPEQKIATVFCILGESDKRNDDTMTGGFGIGAKCGFAYADSFLVTTIVVEQCPVSEGSEQLENQTWKYTWASVKESNGLTALKLISKDRAEGLETGTAICIKIKAEDFDRTTLYVKELFRQWTPRPLIVGELPLTVNQDITFEDSFEGVAQRENIYELDVQGDDPNDPDAIHAAEVERNARIAEAAAKDPRFMQFVWESEDTDAVDIAGLGGCRRNLAPQIVGNRWVAYVDGLPYPMDNQIKGLEMPYGSGYLFFKTGEIEITADRETLRDTPANTAMVRARLDQLNLKLQVIAEHAFDKRVFFCNPDIRGVVENLVGYDKYRIIRELGFSPWEVDGEMSLQKTQYCYNRRSGVTSLKIPKQESGFKSSDWQHLVRVPGRSKLVALVAPKANWVGLRQTITNIIRDPSRGDRDRSVDVYLLRMKSPEGFDYLKRFCGPEVVVIEHVPKAKVIRASRETGCKQVFNINSGKWQLVQKERLEGKHLAKIVDESSHAVIVKVDGVEKQVTAWALERYFEWIPTERFSYACRPNVLKKLTTYLTPELTSNAYREALDQSASLEKCKELNDSKFRSLIEKPESTRNNNEYHIRRGMEGARAVFDEYKPTSDPALNKEVKKLKMLTRRFKRNAVLTLIIEKIAEDISVEQRGELTAELKKYLPDITKLDPTAGSILKEILK